MEGDIGIHASGVAIGVVSVPKASKKRVQSRTHLFPSVYEHLYTWYCFLRKKKLVLSCKE